MPYDNVPDNMTASGDFKSNRPIVQTSVDANGVIIKRVDTKLEKLKLSGQSQKPLISDIKEVRDYLKTQMEKMSAAINKSITISEYGITIHDVDDEGFIISKVNEYIAKGLGPIAKEKGTTVLNSYTDHINFRSDEYNPTNKSYTLSYE